MVLYFCVLIVFSLCRESLKLILAMNPSPRFALYRFLYLLFEFLIMGLVKFLCLRFSWS
jgi:hypothetical protein